MLSDHLGIITNGQRTILFDNMLVKQLVQCIGVEVACTCDIGVDCDSCPSWWCDNPLSHEFYGGVIYNIETDTVTNSLESEGTVCTTFYRPQNSEREITFTGMFFAQNSAALSWGLEWFQAKLQELNTCNSNELFYLKACPCEGQSYEDLIGFIPNVKLKAGITAGDHAPVCCDCDGVGVEIKFTLSATNSDVFVDEIECMNNTFPEETHCKTFNCDPCDNVETQAVEVQYNRKPYLVKVSRNGWCPVGWEIDATDFPPSDGYFDIIETTESVAQKCFIRLKQTNPGDPVTWEPIGWVYNIGDNIPCDCVVELAEICAPDSTSDCTSVSDNKNTLPVALNTDGTVTVSNWDGTGVFPPVFTTPVLQDNCGCTTVSLEDNEIALNADGTWVATNWNLTPSTYFPPDNLTVQNNGFTYTVIEDIPVSSLVGGCAQPIKKTVPTLELECYCDPFEFLQVCCDVEWVCGGDWAAKIVVTGGSVETTNMRVRVFPKRKGEPSYCDDPDFYRCRDMSVDVYIPKIPAKQQLIFDGRNNSKKYVYSAGSEANGGTWFETLSYANLTGAEGATVVATINTHNPSQVVPTDVKIQVVFYRRTNVLLPA